ncbi:MAG: amidohydrolase family protein, partial [bacterium]|nr:amidohydrolase family protein [bacterium]
RPTISAAFFEEIAPRLFDFGGSRVEAMDQNGIDFSVLSLTGPGVQVEPDTATANRMARFANDFLAKQVQLRPQRYGGFAHLALQDPNEAANELERCMTQLGFKGALINGATNGVYLDDPRYEPFWERVEALGAPIYLHPANPFDRPAMYAGHNELWGPVWSWTAETCTHALRLIFSGVFDRHPKAQVILGHMGETLPILGWRLDSRYAISNRTSVIKRQPSEYLGDNIKITTSGVCDDVPLRCAIDAFGIDNVMFSIDYPYESTSIASNWIDTALISETERAAVAHRNATRILRL